MAERLTGRPAQAALTEQARRGVRAWVRHAGRRTGAGLAAATPYGILAFLTASAVAPVAASLGTGGELGAVLTQLGGMGSGYLADVLAGTAQRMRAGPGTAERWRDELAAELLRRLEAGDDGAEALRDEMGRVLRAVDAVGVAVAESARGDEALRRELTAAFGALGQDVGELRWMVADAVDALEGLRREFVEEGAVHRQQLDGTRQTLVAVAQLRQDLLALVAPGPAAPPEDGQRGDPVAAGGPPGAGGESPYPGLAGFQPEDAGWFFGREAVVAELLGRLSEQLAGGPPLALVGASGAGKSSVLRAGLLPALAAGALAGPAPGPAAADAAGWPWLLLTPGPRPLDELVGQTAALAGSAAAPAADRARQDPARFGELAALAGGSGRLVVVVDQLEELFTQGVDPAGQLAFATALASAAPALVVLALRADFYGQCLELPPLAGVLEAGQLLLGPMAVAELRRAVLEPAARAGLAVEPGLVELLLTDLGALSGPGYEPGALPLLGHALRATWERREAGRLTVAGYQATGGIRHAVAETAERTWLALDPDGRAALRELLLSLVAIADERVVRRRRPRSAVDPELLGRLVEARLVTADAEQVELVHEALLTGWPRLEGWVAEARAQILAGQRLGEAARDWQAAGEDPDALYRGARLAAAREWAAGRAELPEPERRFLAASVAAAEAARLAERRAALRLRRLVAGLAVALVLAVGGGLVAVDQRGAAQDREQQARSRQLAAESLTAIQGDELGAMESALRAWSTWPTLEARSALLSAQTRGTLGRLGTGPGGLAVALSPDGGLVAVGHDDGRVQLWDTATLRQRGPDLRAAVSGLILSLAFSPDGRYLAASSVGPAFDGDGLRIWAIPGGEVLHTLPGTELLAWRPDSGAVLASRVDVLGTGRSQLGAWEPGGGRRIGAVPAPEVVVGLAVSPDGRLVAVAGEHGARVRRLADGAKVADLPGAQEPVFLADGTVAGNDASGRIRLWRLPSGRELPGLTAADENRIVTRLEATPEGTLLALGEAGVAESWAVPSGRRLGEFVGFRGTPTDIDVSADGKVVAVTGRGGATTLWRRDTAGLSHPDTVVDLAFDGRGGRLASASSDGAVRTWDVAGRRPTATMRQSGRPSGLAVAPDGTLAASAGDGTILVRDPGGRLVARLRIGASLTGGEVAFSPDGSLLAAAASSPGGDITSQLAVWATAGWRRRGAVSVDPGNPTALAFTPDGGQLVAAVNTTPSPSRILRFRAADLEELGTFDATQQVQDLVPDADGRSLLLAGDGRSVQRRALDDGRLLGELGQHPSTVRALDLSPDGRALATVTAADPLVRLWDARTGAPLAQLTGHDGYPNAVAFSPEGGLLASGGEDGAVILWPLDPAGAVQRICRVLATARPAEGLPVPDECR